MAIWMGTMRFDLSSSGWSESWYADKPDFNSALNSLEKVGKARAKMLSAQAHLTGIRVSDIARRGDAYVKNFIDNGLYDREASERPSDYPTQAWYVQCLTGEGSRRQIHLRGQPDSAFDVGANVHNFRNTVPPAYLLNALEQYIATLKAESWGVYGNDTTANNPERLVTEVKRVVPTVDDSYLITAPGHTLVAGDYLIPYRLSGQYPELTGKLRVKSTLGDTITLFKRSTLSPFPVYDNDGTIRKWAPGVRQILTAAFVRMSKRDTGRPFGLLVGRRTAR